MSEMENITGGANILDEESGFVWETAEGSPASGAEESPEPGNGAATRKFVTFFLDTEEYALPIIQVQEINKVTDITRVPNSPAHIRGVMNLRGKVVPVVDLKGRLRMGDFEQTRDSRVVVVEHSGKVLGLMVDRVSQVANLGEDAIEEAPEEVTGPDGKYVAGVGKIDERMIVLLDLARVLEA